MLQDNGIFCLNNLANFTYFEFLTWPQNKYEISTRCHAINYVLQWSVLSGKLLHNCDSKIFNEMAYALLYNVFEDMGKHINNTPKYSIHQTPHSHIVHASPTILSSPNITTQHMSTLSTNAPPHIRAIASPYTNMQSSYVRHTVSL